MCLKLFLIPHFHVKDPDDVIMVGQFPFFFIFPFVVLMSHSVKDDEEEVERMLELSPVTSPPL